MASRSWNKVELIGNLTRDPELRYTPSGSAVATFTIATNRTFVSDGEKREETDFHRIVAWGKLAELCQQLLKKGNRVFVSGRLQNRSWEGQDGQSRTVTEIVIEDMILLTSKSSVGEYVAGESIPAEAEIPTRQVDEEPAAKTAEEKEKEEAKPAEDEEPSSKKQKEDVGDLDDLPF